MGSMVGARLRGGRERGRRTPLDRLLALCMALVALLLVLQARRLYCQPPVPHIQLEEEEDVAVSTSADANSQQESRADERTPRSAATHSPSLETNGSAGTAARDHDLEAAVAMDLAMQQPGLGAGGVPATLPPALRALGQRSIQKDAINVPLSDRIPYDRKLRDVRMAGCDRIQYSPVLPSASVVIVFHNEPYSLVVRTIVSVLESARRNLTIYAPATPGQFVGYEGQAPDSEFVYLKEVVLVDDSSTLWELREKLPYYIATRLPSHMIKLIRLPKRSGLMAARTRGVAAAAGDVVVVLDAHCEVGADWLRPLLHRIHQKRTAVVMPIIDYMDNETLELSVSVELTMVGGFNFVGYFVWVYLTERERRRRGSDLAPTWSPTMNGGLFAMERRYFWELGSYDEQMRGWGGENLEMSFRVWQCGGSLETLPCSRVGHVFRLFHPYALPASADTHGINTARMAEVWMDEYAELFYMHRPDLRNDSRVGDVSARRQLRAELHCNSFQWYLDTVYPDKFAPVQDALGYGRFVVETKGQRLCLDTLKSEMAGTAAGVFPCHERLTAMQFWTLTTVGQLRTEQFCLQIDYAGSENIEEASRPVILARCIDELTSQLWSWQESGAIMSVQQARAQPWCLLAAQGAQAQGGQAPRLVATGCRAGEPGQRFHIEYSFRNHFRTHEGPLEDWEKRVELIRRRRRAGGPLGAS